MPEKPDNKKTPSKKDDTNNTWMFVAAGAVVLGIAVYFVTRPSEENTEIGNYVPDNAAVTKTQCEIKEELTTENGRLAGVKKPLQDKYDETDRQIGVVDGKIKEVNEDIAETEAILEDRLDDLKQSNKNLIGVSTGFGIFGAFVIALIGIKIVNTIRRRRKS